MEEDLGNLVIRVITDVIKDGNSPEAIRRGIEFFAERYRSSHDIETQNQYDVEAKKFIVAVVGQDNLPGIELYSTYYDSKKIGSLTTQEALPMPARLQELG